MIRRRFEGGFEMGDERVDGAGVDLASGEDDDSRVANILLDFQQRHASAPPFSAADTPLPPSRSH